MAPLSVSTEAGVPHRVKVLATTPAAPPILGPRQAGDGQSGVVVEDVEDFHAAAVGEVPVSDVGLPAVVGQLGAEAFPG